MHTIPEHTRPKVQNSGAYPATNSKGRSERGATPPIPEHIRPFLICKRLICDVFRSISGHFSMVLRYIGDKNIKTDIAMAGKTISMTNFKQAILLKKRGVSNREIARQLKISRDTVNEKFAYIKDKGFGYDTLLKMDDPELEKLFHPGHSAVTDKRHEDFLSRLDYFREQLKLPHVTRYILWEEYIKAFPDGYRTSQFYHHLAQNLKVAKVTTVLADQYVPGQLLMIDFAGDTLPVVDPLTGEITEMQVFVATMPFSDYAFAYAVRTQRSEDFIHALRMCLEHLGGVPQIIKLDNLKAGVRKYHRHEPDFSEALQQMGNHYHFVAQACRPRKPTDKALVESCVRRVYNRVYAKLRGREFHSERELNDALAQALLEHNQTRMQRRPYSRQECFVASEKDELQGLPETPFELVYTAHVTVQQNCHVLLSADNHYYSVNHVYVGKKAIMRYTRSIVKIYIDAELVSTHKRSHDRFNFYVTDKNHLASNSVWIRDQNVDTYVRRGDGICPALGSYIKAVFDDGLARGFAVECRYNTCNGILSNARKYPPHIVEQACSCARERDVFASRPFAMLLESMNRLDVANRASGQENPTPSDGENLRGKTKFA